MKMVDGVTYDTGKAESICSTKKAPDDEFYTELFRDASGSFFVAYFELWDGGHSHISPIDTNGAKSFLERYGKATVAE